MVKTVEILWDTANLSYMKICILTATRKWIKYEIVVMVRRKSYRVGVIEEDDEWHPFKINPNDNNSKSDEENEILETWN